MDFPNVTDPGRSRRTRVKICGITNPTDAEAAVSLGADSLGFNFYPPSTRFLGMAEQELGWLRELGSLVSRVAVCVNMPCPEDVCRWRETGLVDVVQLHGDEDEDYCGAVVKQGVPVLRAIRVRDETSLLDPERFGTRDLLLDAFQPKAYGGTGETCDWELAHRFVASHPRLRVVLSGGLTPENVGEAIRRVRPYAVDVASGVEDQVNPRRKDPARLRDFMAAVAGAG